MKTLSFKIYDLIWITLLPLINCIYMFIERLYIHGTNLLLSFETNIPLVPVFVIPYMYCYAFVPISLFFYLIEDRKKYMKAFICLIITLLVCYTIFLIFPTEYPRPIVLQNDIFSKLLQFVYNSDTPFNCFPSVHVATTYLMMRFCNTKKSKLFFIYQNVVGSLIILSTLLVKQHFFLDIVAAIILVEIVLYLSKKIPTDFLDFLLDLPLRLLKKVENIVINK